MSSKGKTYTAKNPPWLKTYPKDIPWDQKIKPVSLQTMLGNAADKFPTRDAVDFMGYTLTYSELLESVRRVAKGLQDRGLKKGDRVGLFLPNCPYYLIFYYGVMMAGGIVVNFNPLYAHREIEHQINDSGAKIMVSLNLAPLAEKLEKLLPSSSLEKIILCRMQDILPPLKSLLFGVLKRRQIYKIPHGKEASFWHYGDLVKSDALPQDPHIDMENDVALLQYTGGTTGVPKGAMLTHANLYTNAFQSRAWLADQNDQQEIVLGVIPFFHVFAMTTVVNLGVMIGAKIVALPRFEIDQTLKTIHEKKPTLFPAVPTLYNALLNAKNRTKYDLSSIRFCISGGAPLPLEVKDKFETVTGCKLVEGYGLTEASPVTNCNPISGQNKRGSIGLPLPETFVDILSLEDQKTRMPIGEKGEVCIRGPQVMKGYWQNEKATKETIKRNRLHTGDVGYIDEDGYVFLVDRLKDMILCSGFNVYPRNIEEAVYRHLAVEECVAAGIPDDYRGETVKIWVKLVDGQELTAESLKTFLKDHLAPYEMPAKIEFRNEPLPKTLIGKLSRKDLLEQEKDI